MFFWEVTSTGPAWEVRLTTHLCGVVNVEVEPVENVMVQLNDDCRGQLRQMWNNTNCDEKGIIARFYTSPLSGGKV